MTDSELEEIVRDCPILYHMAERGAWKSIRDQGLLSTGALLDLYGITGDDRAMIESERRSTSIPIYRNGRPRVVVRDQLPMTDESLRRCLLDNMKPRDWYELLNSKVFFWLTKDRLHRLTSAKAYRGKPHDVLEVNTKSLIEVYRQRIWLCPMNSGNTKPYPHQRGKGTFLRIRDYPYSCWRRKRKTGERVVELAVDYSIPDILRHVDRVVVMRNTEIEDALFESRMRSS